jgi:hypothetical protein
MGHKPRNGSSILQKLGLPERSQLIAQKDENLTENTISTNLHKYGR